MKTLCHEWFPIKYPDTWYEDITSTNKFYTLAACINNAIIGLLVAEIKPCIRCHAEDRGLLCDGQQSDRVAYILSLGVVRQHRRHGIATALLTRLIGELAMNPLLEDVRAVYLHVLTTNTAAIVFYQKSHFVRHKFLPLYYSIYSSSSDGYSYVRYINGGRPPYNFFDLFRWFFSATGSIFSCKRIFRLKGNIVHGLVQSLLSKSTRNKCDIYTC